MYFSWSHWNDLVSSIKGGFEAMAGLIRVGQNWKRQLRPCRWYLNYNSPSALQNIRRRHPKPCVHVKTKSADPWDDMNVCVDITLCNGNSNHIWIICLETCWNSRSCYAAETQTAFKEEGLAYRRSSTVDCSFFESAPLNLDTTFPPLWKRKVGWYAQQWKETTTLDWFPTCGSTLH